jgi:Arc/MetJ-type ribon-helix-helix transcriptional regulator
MEIRLRPELEELIKRDLARGPYSTVDEYVEHAVTLLHEEESWLAEHGSDIGAQIEAGYAAAKRGELIDAEDARSQLHEKKRSWLADKREE